LKSSLREGDGSARAWCVPVQSISTKGGDLKCVFNMENVCGRKTQRVSYREKLKGGRQARRIFESAKKANGTTKVEVERPSSNLDGAKPRGGKGEAARIEIPEGGGLVGMEKVSASPSARNLNLRLRELLERLHASLLPSAAS